MVPTFPTFSQLVEMLRRYPKRWQLPAAAVVLLAAAYALFAPRPWEATQSLLVRNEAAGALEGGGKFHVVNEMKSAQETIIEIARSPEVLRETLVEVGPPKNAKSTANFPTRLEIDEFAEEVNVSPPKGAEFGSTEVIYVKIKDVDRDRAVKLAEVFSKQLAKRLQEVRNARAGSIINELSQTVEIARENLMEATAKVAEIERSVGSDLAELRMLYQPSSESDLRRRTNEIENELRQSTANVDSNIELLALLKAAAQDPSQLLATPNRLLESQPALRRLKDGLIDAQLRSAQLRGVMSADHPKARAAVDAEQQVIRNLHSELEVAIRGVEVDLKLASARVVKLQEQVQNAKTRMERLAGVRAEYANLLSAVEHRTQVLQAAQKRLADAESSQAGARLASIINPVGAPDPGSKPTGPSRKIVLLAGLVGGLLLGVGFVVLTVPVMVIDDFPATVGGGQMPVVPSFTMKQAFSTHRPR